jgi:anti-anti-sigma factor
MKTRIQKDSGMVIVSLSGCLDFESAQPFRESLDQLAQSKVPVLFDMGDLSFVGSCGITTFVQTLKEFNMRAKQPPVYTNVKSEFKRIIAAFDLDQSFRYSDTPGTPAPTTAQPTENDSLVPVRSKLSV